MGLNAAQKQAVEYLSGPLLVLAGPGTGKTQLLSEKVAYILKNTDTNPENILCLTFTESGASNMRERLLGMIKNDALSVNISTYHAFGTDILTQYQHYSEDYDRQLTNAIDELTQFKIIKGLQEELPARDILRGDNPKNIIEVIGEAKSAQLDSKDLKLIAEQNLEDAEILGQAISPLLKKVVPRQYQVSLEQAYQPIDQLLSKYHETAPITKQIERVIAALARDLSAAIVEAEATHSIKALTAWRNGYFEQDAKGNYRLRGLVANKKLLSLSRLMSRYEKYLREQGLYDFNDMIEEAIRVLRTDQGFKLSLEERYQYIMLDEFQDTNPSQFAIVKELTDYDQPQIMAVGDDDQAIYEFQGALSTNLTDYQKHYNAKVITLTENYRSTQEVLDFAHQIILQAPDRFADKKLVAHAPAPVKSQIRRYEFSGADNEYAFVAEQVAQLIKSGVKQRQIAIISHKNRYFEPLLPFLKAHPEIKIAYEKRDNLLEDQKIHEIITILRLVHDLASEQRSGVQVLEILTYPFFGLPTVEVLKLAAEARESHRSLLECLTEADPARYSASAKFQEVATFLADLVAQSFTEPLESLINQIVAKMEAGDPADAEAYEQFRFYENLAALEGKLHRQFGERKLTVADLISMVDDYQAAEMALTVTSPYRDADDAVQVMSAHKAKGLEFEHVFIISADHLAWGKGKGNNNSLTLPKNLTQIRHTGITDSERIRVLYVALTRAKRGLTITNSLHDYTDRTPARLEYLHETAEEIDGQPHVYSEFLPTKEVTLEYDAAPPGQREANLRNWLSVYRPTSPEMRAIYQNRVKNWRMSASALTSFIDIVYAGPEEFFKNYILRAPREPINESLALGDLTHKAFEALTKQQLSDQATTEFFLEEVKKAELPDSIAQAVTEKGLATLESSLAQFGDVLRQGQAEVDFGPERLVIEGIPVTGKIDHLIVNDADQTIEIYDFKTSKYHKERWQSHLTLYKYMLQLGFYKLLVNHSPKYAKYRVTKAHILFVTPDQDDQVYDKVYEYTAEEERALLDLMRAVYAQVSTLDFVDDDELMVPPRSSRTLRDIKAFIQLLLAKNPTT